MQTSYIWFDLGYTLVYQEREKEYQQFWLEQGIELSLEDIEEAYHLTDKLFMREYPGALGKQIHTYMPWYVGVLNYTLGVRFDLHDQCRRLRDIQIAQSPRWKPFPFSHPVLALLKKASVGIGLISNWDASARTVLEETGLLPYLDHIIVSSEVQVEKPDVRIFLKAAELAGVDPKQCLYVGDNYYDDVVGSAKAGMKPILINRFGTLGIEEITFERTLLSVEELPELLFRQDNKIIS
ncbi:HAD-IA family hydrolase [Paenibacillus validus]|uniref:HAD-IA family hydrolase n=1 Tax=Paenibacillus validus TaxID=44253 RepID=A0A7X3CSA1_9BACL|nr:MULTISPECIES: HAD-IA family hydrolase [Paenibacillus]MED4599193.1 HAD-IA family hydrolase [Paenibacillus validus]MED4606500.1 HAD-IA family hydrolase [Paenibacillus validus]MUG71560.1 HAD-IA family hydrolase [Paenibacillus validus]